MSVEDIIVKTSSLRAKGRADDAVALLAEAVAAYSDEPILLPFLALALLDAGHPRAAVATLLGCVLDVARPGMLAGYERVLSEAHQELLSPSQS